MGGNHPRSQQLQRRQLDRLLRFQRETQEPIRQLPHVRGQHPVDRHRRLRRHRIQRQPLVRTQRRDSTLEHEIYPRHRCRPRRYQMDWGNPQWLRLLRRRQLEQIYRQRQRTAQRLHPLCCGGQPRPQMDRHQRRPLHLRRQPLDLLYHQELQDSAQHRPLHRHRQKQCEMDWHPRRSLPLRR